MKTSVDASSYIFDRRVHVRPYVKYLMNSSERLMSLVH